jgi:hypothetical protein
MPATKEPKKTSRYLAHTPKKLLAGGRIIVHSHVKPVEPLGLNGFRAWTDEPDDNHYERCKCGWANGIEHYRVNVGK